MSIIISSTLLSMPLISILKLLVILSCARFAFSATKDEWRNRAIYQVITDRYARTDGSTTTACDVAEKAYCGGTWDGLMNKLDYIQGMGFTAVWISPAVKGVENSTAGENYHGFWQQDLMNLNSHFGTADELKELSDELHRRNMYLMVDILVNNLAYPGPGASMDVSVFPAPFNDKSWFHQFCYISDYDVTENYQKCWLGNDQVSLVDVKTELPQVRNYFTEWAKGFVSNYSIDGFRIDAVRHVEKQFWEHLQENVDTFMIGEVFTRSVEEACDYTKNALDAVLNFPLMWAITATYGNQLAPVGVTTSPNKNITEFCRDPTLLGHFVENHDVPRFASATNDTSQQKNAIAFAMTGDGIPIVYYGSEQGFDGQGDPENREALWLSGYNASAPIYQMIKAINTARNAIIKASKDPAYNGYWRHKTKVVFNDENVIAVRKGFDASLVSITTNKGSNAPNFGPLDILDTNFHEKQEIIDVIGCMKQTTGSGGAFRTTIKKGEPQVWVPTSFLGDTLKSVCPTTSKGESLPTSSAAAMPLRPFTVLMVSCMAMVLTFL